jgi:hypothetical protein
MELRRALERVHAQYPRELEALRRLHAESDYGRAQYPSAASALYAAYQQRLRAVQEAFMLPLTPLDPGVLALSSAPISLASLVTRPVERALSARGSGALSDADPLPARQSRGPLTALAMLRQSGGPGVREPRHHGHRSSPPATRMELPTHTLRAASDILHVNQQTFQTSGAGDDPGLWLDRSVARSMARAQWSSGTNGATAPARETKAGSPVPLSVDAALLRSAAGTAIATRPRLEDEPHSVDEGDDGDDRRPAPLARAPRATLVRPQSSRATSVYPRRRRDLIFCTQ